jgi:outer membrane protein TolC
MRRVWSWTAGISFGAAAAFGPGCKSVEPESFGPHARPLAEMYPALASQPKSGTIGFPMLQEAASAKPAKPESKEIRTARVSDVEGRNEQGFLQAALRSPLPDAAADTVGTTNAAEAVGPSAEQETIDLEIALRLAGVENPTIALAREQIREALAAQLAARSLLLPSINIGGNYHYHSGNLQASFGGVRNITSQSLYLGFGARTLAAENIAFPGIRLFAHLGDAVYEPLAARQEVSARRAESQAVQNDILLRVSNAYLTLIGAEARLDILKQGDVQLAEIVRLTRVYAEKGQGRLSDAGRAATHADLLQQQIQRAEEEVAVASARLCRLINIDPSTRLRSPGGAVQPFQLIQQDADSEPLVNEAVQSRPELFAGLAEIQEAQVRVRQERVRPLLPLLSIGYSGGLFGGGGTNVASTFGPMQGRADFDVFAVWTMQNLGLGNRAQVRRRTAEVGVATAARDRTLNEVREQVLSAQADARAAARQIEVARIALSTAEEGYRLESQRIRQGLGLPIETLDSFQQLLDARMELLRAITGFDIAQLQLFVAIGRNPLSQPAPEPVPPAPAVPPAKP